jgi:mRNA interferase RelE/StbE
MRLRRLVGFVDAYGDLPPAQRERLDKALRLLVEDRRHPALQVKRVRGLEGVWEARASLSLRITFVMNGDTIILRNVGSHDKTIRGA